jgi:hypothetical protein
MALLCVAQGLSATAVVIVRTENGFAVAADSGLSNNSGEPISLPACKIFTAGNSVVFGFGGLMASSTFSPEAKLRGLIDGTDLDSIAKKVQDAIIPALTEEAKQLRRNAPEKFRFLLEGNDIFRLFVIVPQRALLQGYKVGIERGGGVVVALSGTIDCVAGTPTCRTGKVMRIGEEAEIVKYLSQHSPQAASYADLAQSLVSLEVAASPKTVRLPIDVLEITSSGIVWKQKKPECECRR